MEFHRLGPNRWSSIFFDGSGDGVPSFGADLMEFHRLLARESGLAMDLHRFLANPGFLAGLRLVAIHMTAGNSSVQTSNEMAPAIIIWNSIAAVRKRWSSIAVGMTADGIPSSGAESMEFHHSIA
jgi:hypothetical protein